MNLDKVTKEIRDCRVAITMLDQAINNLEATIENRKLLEKDIRVFKNDAVAQSNELIEARIQIANISVRLIGQFSNPNNQEA